MHTTILAIVIQETNRMGFKLNEYDPCVAKLTRQ